MQPITAPIKHNQTGSVAVSLIECILFLIGKNLLKIYDAPNKPNQDEINLLIAGAKLELAAQVYGEKAQQLVFYFQLQNSLGDQLRGGVDDKTAALLNQILEKCGAFNVEKIFVVTGVVTDSITGVRQSNMLIKAFDRDGIKLTLLSETNTNASGEYLITFSESAYKNTPAEREGVELVVKAFDEFTSEVGKVSITTSEQNIVLDIVTASDVWTVEGQVTRGNVPLNHVLIEVFDRDLRKRQHLCKTTSDSSGYYRATFRTQDFQRADKKVRATPWLIIEAKEKKNSAAVVLERQQGVMRHNIIDIYFTQQWPSEWELISEAVPPLLEGQANDSDNPLPINEIKSSDYEFLERETGFGKNILDAWVNAYKISDYAAQLLSDSYAVEKVVLQNSGWQFFYAFSRRDVNADINSLIMLSAQELKNTWSNARALNRVPDLDEKTIAILCDAVEIIRKLQLLKPTSDNNHSFARLVGGIPIELPQNILLDALGIYHEKGLINPSDFLVLKNNHPKSETEINRLVRHIRVHQLVDGDNEFSKKLHTKLLDDSDSIAPLAVLPSKAWLQMAEHTSFGLGRALRTQADVEKQHILIALQARIDSGQLQLESTGEIKKILKQDGEKSEAILQGRIYIKNKDSAPASFKVLQNIGQYVRTGINIEMAGSLMQAGVSSPAAAIQYGQDVIREKLGGSYDKEVFGDVVKNFIQRVDPLIASLNAFLIEGSNQGRHYGSGIKQPLPDGVIDSFPDVPSVFGDMDECMCRPCESMLGLPAYLVDLLNLLKKQSVRHGSNALDLLSEKRDDIAAMDLSCDKAETVRLHIDIVLGVLEKAVILASPTHEHPYLQAGRAIYPWSLPFHRTHFETKIFLQKLDVMRLDLLPLDGSDKQFENIAAETLNLSMNQQDFPNEVSDWQLLTEIRRGENVWKAYGLQSGTITIFDPVVAKTVTGSVEALLPQVSILLDRTGLTLDELDRIVDSEVLVNTANSERLSIDNRGGCKTSEMRVKFNIDVDLLFSRLHRFVRLKNKIPEWTIEQLALAIKCCGGLLRDVPRYHIRLLRKLATIKRLCDRYKFPIAQLLALADSADKLPNFLGLSHRQYLLLKDITGLEISTLPDFSWEALDHYCISIKRIFEAGLTIEQVAEAKLTAAQLTNIYGELPPSIKTNQQIEKILIDVQQRLRGVLAVKADVSIESQVVEALAAIFDSTTASKIVEAISSAGARNAADRQPETVVLAALTVTRNIKHGLGDWYPLLPADKATKILAVDALNKLDANARFELLLESIAEKHRQRELIRALTDIIGLPEIDVIKLLAGRLLLDDENIKSEIAAEIFLEKSFWAGNNVSVTNTPRLHAWVDRASRLVGLIKLVGLDSELMEIADLVAAHHDSSKSFWRDMLVSSNPSQDWVLNWSALIDLIWLQKPEQLSRATLNKLLGNLKDRDGQMVLSGTLQPLATHFEITNDEALVFAKHAVPEQVITSYAKTLRNPTNLRRIVELLLLSRKLGVNSVQLAKLINLEGNDIASVTAMDLLRAKIGEQEWEVVTDKIQNPVRQQRRDAMVAHLVHVENLRNTNDLYEKYLIDPKIEPCFETTELLEAVTATQLFIQRILFGLEPKIIASVELKQHWIWMRNYRVWEANRKIFLFPENWLFPELRDDKSSSFKQLESALGQGELTKELAEEAFGQFLDDVAQIGQTHVLGMFEHAHESKRSLYVIGRSANPPYHYYWRQCVDFGSKFMEWTPWLRIELDIEGDHVLPFVMNEELYVAWPLIKRIAGTDDKPDQWQIQLAWARYNGSTWKKQILSRDKRTVDVASFSDNRIGFALRYEPPIVAPYPSIAVYYQSKISGNFTVAPNPPDVPNPQPKFILGQEYYEPAKLAALILTNPANFPDEYKGTLRLYALKMKYKDQVPEYEVGSRDWWRMLDIFTDDKVLLYQGHNVEYFNFDAVAKADVYIAPRTTRIVIPTWSEQVALIGAFLEYFKSKNLITINRTSAWNEFVLAIGAKSSRINIKCRTWLKLKYEDGQVGLKEVATPPEKFSAKIGLDYIPLKPFRPDDLNVLGVSHEIVRFGQIGAQQVSITYTEQLPDKILPATTIRTAVVDEGKTVDQTLHFVIDGTEFHALELGFSLDDDAVLNQCVIFRVDPEELVLSEIGNGSKLMSWAGNSRPWMNGFQEKYKQLNEPFSIAPTPSEKIEILRSSSNQFWVVGASSAAGNSGVPRILYYREGASKLFMDVGTLSGIADAGLNVFPDSYQSAIQRKLRWAMNKEAWADLISQFDEFGAIDLDRSSPVYSDEYDDVSRGARAFDSRLPYACYNWEVFFHAPLMIANQLSKQHKFEEAERWLRYIFDPTDHSATVSNPKPFFKFKVFKELDLSAQVINDLTILAKAFNSGITNNDVVNIQKLISRWRDLPFRPFVIARRRHVAFLWNTLFAYLDNLLSWADNLFRRDTRESINEAVMLYVLVEQILGRRPQQHDGKSQRIPVRYNDLANKWDDFANAWISIGSSTTAPSQGMNAVKPDLSGILYFCKPFNEKIVSYWNTVDARLVNIRNCRNIEGVSRALPFLDAPIDPELLVRATAAGLDLGDVISGLYAPPPHYRYNILAARAAELTNEVKSLGAAMLSAIEKRDIENISQLRSSNEISLLKLVSDVKQLQIIEAERNIDALRASRKAAENRYNQYQRLMGARDSSAPKENENVGEASMLGSHDDGLASHRSGLGLIKEENEQYLGVEGANTWATAASITKVIGASTQVAGSILAALPLDKITNAAKVNEMVGTAASFVGDAFSSVSQSWRTYAEQQGMLAGHIRRRDEWAFQSNQTLKELQQIDKQLLANQIRIDITKKELNNHEEQLEQSKAMDEVLRSKFTNEQLYQWMLDQLSKLYFSTYRMALDMARRAERAASRELGTNPLSILGNEYWDSLRMGLLAGEKLHQDLKRLEISYIDQNRREFELTKHISLRRLNPQALIDLRFKNTDSKNSCEFTIPEWLFDLDTPGHYLRRIKSVSVSIPCVVGPYSSINCKLTLLKSEIRHYRTIGNYPRRVGEDDPRFTDYFGASESIVTSTANADSGLFEVPLHDERFLPFEHAGAISTWRLELPDQYAQFDYSTISDVILTVRYTARDGGEQLRDLARNSIDTLLNPPATNSPKAPPEPLKFPLLLSGRSDFPTEWAKAKTSGETLRIAITKNFLPYWFEPAEITTISTKKVVKVIDKTASNFISIDDSVVLGDVFDTEIELTDTHLQDVLVLVELIK